MISEQMYSKHREHNYKAQEKKNFFANEKKERIESYRKMIARNPYRKETK